MIRLRLISKDMMPLVPGKIYRLEDVAEFSKFILIKILELFGESAWGVADIMGGIRKRLKNYSVFYQKYSKLSREQKKILTILSQTPGQAFLVKEIATKEEFSNVSQAQKEITSLVSTSWLVGGAYKNEMAVFIVEEVSALINMVPDFLAYLDCEKQDSDTTAEINISLFDDLLQLTSYMLTDPIKITNTGFFSKTSLKKLMPRLSHMASREWEGLAGENYYPFGFNILMKICEYVDAIEIKTEEAVGRAQFLRVKEWNAYLNTPSEKKLRIAMLAHLGLVRRFPSNDLYIFLENLLCCNDNDKRFSNFSTPLKLWKNLNKGTTLNKHDLGKSGEYYDNLFTGWILEPLFYLGIFERITVPMPTPWRQGAEITERHLWRLTPLGRALSAILRAEKEGLSSKNDRQTNALRDGWLERTLRNNALFAGKLDSFFPAVLSKEMVLQNDMTFFAPQNAPTSLIWLLYVFGEIGQRGYIVSGKFTKESIIKALKAGMSIDTLITFIKKESKNELSSTVLRVIEDWSLSYNRAIFAQIMVVVCDSPELAAELSANTKLSEKVLGILGPQTVFIRREDEKFVRQWLEKKGRVPLPGIHECERLTRWVGERIK